MFLIWCSNGVAPGNGFESPRLKGGEMWTLAAMSIAANPWEEAGWRGFAQFRLQEHWPWHWSAVIVGVLWGLWHLPFFVWVSGPMMHFPFWSWFAAIVAESVILGWLYNRSGHSIAVASLFHVAMNAFSGVFGVASFTALALLNGLLAALVAVWAGTNRK